MLGFRKAFGTRGVVSNISAAGVTSFTYQTTAQTITNSLTLPGGIQSGDIAVLFMSAWNTNSTVPTAQAPSGWTNIQTSSNAGYTPNGRVQSFYRICTGTESGTSVTCMSGTNTTQSQVLIYRPSGTVTAITPSFVNEGVESAAPPDQTLTMTGITGPYIGIALYASDGSVSASSTTTATRTTGPSGGFFIKTFEAVNSSTSFSTSTISMTDSGINIMISYTIKLT